MNDMDSGRRREVSPNLSEKTRAQEIRLADNALHQRRPERHRVFDVPLEEGRQESIDGNEGCVC